MRVKKILILTQGYPTKSNEFIFVKNFVDELSKYQVLIRVISPVSLTKYLFRLSALPPRIYRSNNIIIERPRYISTSNLSLFSFNISNVFMNLSIFFSSYKKSYDVIYSHFWTQIPSAYLIAKTKPIFIVTGESRINIDKMYPKYILNIFISRVTGIIALSSRNLRISSELNLIGETSTIVIPNGFNPQIFHKKFIDRKNYNYSYNDFIIGFIGNSNKSKGVINLLNAFKELNIENIKLIIIGDVSVTHKTDSILYTGIISQEEISNLLSVIDLYCHPSIAEGSSNAIIEALACGKPVMASNKEFNNDILREDFSIRIDVESIEQIKNGILSLYNDRDLLKKMGENALEFIKDFTLEKRVKKVINFINEKSC